MIDTLKLITILLFCALLSYTNSAVGQFSVDSRVSGTWGDPAHDGEGFVLHVLNPEQALVYWFTYDETGAQRWFFSQGTIGEDSAVFDSLLQTEGGVFGEGFDAGKVKFNDVGQLTISWSDCSSARAEYSINGVAGGQQLRRVSTLAGLDCEASEPVAAPISGTWGDFTRNGEGLVIDQLVNGLAIVYWFSYDPNGQQAWFYGVGELDGNQLLVTQVLQTHGGIFGPDYDPAQVQYESWGHLEVELQCDFGKFDYASALSRYGNGKQTLIRVASPENRECSETPAANILLVIADDLGLDTLDTYGISAEPAHTPTLDRLAAEGLVFDNAWSSPTCSPTRAGILTGKYSSRTGVFEAGDVLSTNETSIQSYIHQHLPGKYSDAVIGKWHLGPTPGGVNHPADLGISYFSGILTGAVGDYENWNLVSNGARSDETAYTTSKLVDLAIDWTHAQEKPWFLWLAFNAPHSPYHLPPGNLHQQQLPGTDADIEANPLPYYLAAIEALDTELGRLLDSFDEDTRDNTIVIFVGDNGTPREVIQSPYSRSKAKGTLYQGGIHVPLLVQGPGIARNGQREAALVNTTDLFSTIASVAGVNVDQVHDSVSFSRLFESEDESERFYQFSEQSVSDTEEWAVSDGAYKLIEDGTGAQEFYNLLSDPYENTNLLASGSVPTSALEDLQYLANEVRQGTGPKLPSQLFNYANIELPEHYIVNSFPAQVQFQHAAVEFDNTPADNPITDAGATLGRVLFYDKRLSANGTISCSSCHQQEHGFSDPAVRSSGFEGGLTRRHSMGLANARFYFSGKFFWDERAATLEEQVLMPIQDPVEMGLTLTELERVVSEQTYYPALFEDAFGDSDITIDRIAKALAQFLRSIVSTTSKYDLARSEVNSPLTDFPGFTDLENEGKSLFLQPRQLENGDAANCAGCHVSEAFVGPIPNGLMGTTTATTNGLDAESTDDPGIFETTGNPNDIGKFKAPALANIAVRAPYMHDGRFATLQEVIEHYSNGIQNHANLSPPLLGSDGEPIQFNFTQQEMDALEAFLNTLTDTGMLADEKYSDPFE